MFHEIVFLKIEIWGKIWCIFWIAWLYLSIIYEIFKTVQVCVNDDLVAKNFACYISPKEDKNLDSSENPRLNMKSASFSNKLNPALTLWPMFLQGKDSQGMKSEWILTRYVSFKLSYL